MQTLRVDYELVNRLLERLETDWEASAGTLPVSRLRTYVSGVDGPVRSNLLEHLLAVDLEIRRKRGEDGFSAETPDGLGSLHA